MAEESDNSDAVYNVKPTRKKKKSGGFQSMGLSYSVLKGVLKKGYKVPTPIQRKAIPLIVEGKDVVAMARTGSGKTAAFLLPMFERLKTHVANVGSRGLILSPTRELALQTFSFAKELGKFTALKAAVILGGDSMEDQFSKIHENPDIIIATPGRLLHVVIEMDLKLSSIEYVVFDEADRLFEMGFREQLQELLSRLPDHRQTLLFSATLPNILVDFVKAGLNDPVLIRLDTEKKLSEHLKVSYISCRTNDKMAILLHLLKFVIKSGQLTVVFLATKHHVEYAREILARANIPCSYIYSSLDPTARKINIAKFKFRKVGILLVTDIAARGIDIPFLDNVINYNFSAKPKLFVHRVGRVARAGRSGAAYSLVAPDEAAFLLDLHLFLGQPINLSGDSTDNADGVYGSVPQNVIDEEYDLLSAWHESSVDLRNMKQVCENAYKQYIKSRPLPSSESAKRIKEILQTPPKIHPLFKGTATAAFEDDRVQLLENMKAYRPNITIFEIGATGKNQASEIMRSKRKHHCKIIKRSCDPSFEKLQLQINKKKSNNPPKSDLAKNSFAAKLGERDQVLEITHHKSVKKRKHKENSKDEAFYLSYRPADHYTEKGLEIEKSFSRQMADAVLDFTTDDADKIQSQKKNLKWDRKKKKFIRNDQESDPKRKKIKTESGTWIPASYKSNHYKQWKENCKFDQRKETQEDEETEFGKERKGMKAALQKNKQKQKRYRPELKTKDQILKARKKKSSLLFHQKKQHTQRAKRNSKKKK